MVSFSVSQLLNGDSYSSPKLPTECIHQDSFICQSTKYESRSVRRILNESLYSQEEETPDELASSPIFEKTDEEENNFSVSTSPAIQLQPRYSYQPNKNKIEKIAVEAQIEIDNCPFLQSSDRITEKPFLQDPQVTASNPSQIDFDSILHTEQDNGSLSHHSDISRSSLDQNISLSCGRSQASPLHRLLSLGTNFTIP